MSHPTHRPDARGLITACTSCGQANRLLYGNLGKTARCGKCQTPLAAPLAPVELASEEAFHALTTQSVVPVLIDFWAPWCGPCRTIAPELEKVAATLAGQWVIGKVNTDAQTHLSTQFGIRSIPTLAVFRGGKEIHRQAGALNAAGIHQMLRALG
jgi:thioredoxin 2